MDVLLCTAGDGFDFRLMHRQGRKLPAWREKRRSFRKNASAAGLSILSIFQ
jgi:hypothetical protein